jgi:hypothetical protein
LLVRRWDEVVDELAVVAGVEQERASMIGELAAYPPLAHVEERAADRLVARLADGVRVRIRLVPAWRRGLALVEETGPAFHLDALRARARSRGVEWNALAEPDEARLYAALDLPVIPVEARAWSPVPPPADLDDLVSASDVQGFVHCHTTTQTDATRWHRWPARQTPGAHAI